MTCDSCGLNPCHVAENFFNESTLTEMVFCAIYSNIYGLHSHISNIVAAIALSSQHFSGALTPRL